jgi:hypothetical protein
MEARGIEAEIVRHAITFLEVTTDELGQWPVL